MTDVLIVNLSPYERSALRVMLRDLEMNVVGEADTWRAAITGACEFKPDMILVDWDLVVESGGSLAQLRSACPPTTVLVLISSLNARQQAAVLAGADSFISRDETPDRVAQSLRSVVGHDEPSPIPSTRKTGAASI